MEIWYVDRGRRHKLCKSILDLDIATEEQLQ